MHPIVHGSIDEELIKKVAIRTKGVSGSSGLDANDWRRVIEQHQISIKQL